MGIKKSYLKKFTKFTDKLNDIVAEMTEFKEEVETFVDGHSDAWRESDAADEYDDFVYALQDACDGVENVAYDMNSSDYYDA